MGGAIALWLIGLIRNGLDERGAARLFGKPELAVRPNAGLAPFLFGRSYAAPEWITSLQAEPYAVICAFRLGSYKGLSYVIVGTDSDVSKSTDHKYAWRNFLTQPTTLIASIFLAAKLDQSPHGYY